MRLFSLNVALVVPVPTPPLSLFGRGIAAASCSHDMSLPLSICYGKIGVPFYLRRFGFHFCSATDAAFYRLLHLVACVVSHLAR